MIAWRRQDHNAAHHAALVLKDGDGVGALRVRASLRLEKFIKARRNVDCGCHFTRSQVLRTHATASAISTRRLTPWR